MSASVEQIVEGLEVKTATDIAPELLNQFYERVYPQRAAFLKASWRWLYRVGEFADVPAPLVAMLEGEVVGHAGLIPVTLRRGDERHTAIWFVDFAVLSGHQRKGIGILLTRDWMASCPLHITFCNERSIGVFLKYGWEARFHTFSFKLLLRPERNAKLEKGIKRALAQTVGTATRTVWRGRVLGKSSFSVEAATDDNLAAFANDESNARLHVERSKEFLHWRIVAHPRANEYFVLSSKKYDGAALVRVVAEEGGYRRLHVLSLSGEASNKRLLSNLFAGVTRYALDADIHHVWFVTSDAAIINVAKRWFPIFNRARFACHANTNEGTKFLSGTNHFWECLDSDFDLSIHD